MEENNNMNLNVRKEQNNKNTILIIIVILSLLLLGLTYYTFFARDNNKVDNDNKPNQSEKEDDANKINYEVKKTYNSEQKMDFYNLYVNGVDTKIKSNIPIEVKEFHDLLIVNGGYNGGVYFNYAIDKTGKQIDLSKLNYNSKYPTGYDKEEGLINACNSSRISDGNLFMMCTRYNQGNIYYFCDLKSDDIVTYEQKFEYLGNGKFSVGIIVNEEKVSEHKFNLKCEDKGTSNHGKTYN